MKPYLLHLDDVPPWRPPIPPPFGDTIGGTSARNLGNATSSRTLGAWVVDLPPGSRSSFTHAHSDEEEMAYVLAGTCTLRIIEPGAEPEDVPVRAGNFVSFPAGTGIAHSFVNSGTEDARILVVGERRPGVDRVLYPEHPDWQEWMRARNPARIWTRDEG